MQLKKGIPTFKMNINPETIQKLRQMGYRDDQINKAISELQVEDKGKLAVQYQQAQQRQQAQNVPRVTSPFATPEQENMIKFQLDVNGTLNQIYHLLRSDVLTMQVINGVPVQVWIENTNKDKRKLNEVGINDSMEILAVYLNKEIFLGNYEEEMILRIVSDISHAFKDQLYMNYERYGWVDESEETGGQKRTYYRTLVLQVSNIILSAYMRAWKGGERISLRENRNVQQNEMIQPGISINNNPQMRERSLINPMRYLKGKYY